MEEDHYYPYGLKHNGYSTLHLVFDKDDDPGSGIILTPVNPFLGDSYKYKFGGKEYSDEFDLNTYDFGARNYDPALGRWMNIDPVTHHSQSPYIAFDGNPVFFADPSGADVVPVFSDGYMEQKSTTTTGAVELSGTYEGATTKSSGTDYVNKSGGLVHSSHKGEGNIRIVDEGFDGKNKELEANSKPLYENFKQVGSDQQVQDFVTSVFNNQGVNMNFFKSIKTFHNEKGDELKITGVQAIPTANGDWIYPGTDNKYNLGIGLSQGLSYMFSSYSNLLSGISHESFHLNELNTIYNNMMRGTMLYDNFYEYHAEQRAYSSQVSNKYWNNTTTEFKKRVINEFKRFSF